MSENSAKVLSGVVVLATKAAISTGESFAETKFKQTLALTAIMCAQQAQIIASGKEIEKSAYRNAWNAFLKGFANKGNMVWRDTQHLVDAFMARKGDEKIKLVREYIDTKPKGEDRRLVDGLANVNTWFRRAVEHVTKNESGVIRTIIELANTDACEAKAVYDRLYAELSDIFGGSWNSLTERFPQKPRATVDAVDSMVKRAEGLGTEDLQRLVARLQSMFSERLAGEAANGIGEDDEDSADHDENAFDESEEAVAA